MSNAATTTATARLTKVGGLLSAALLGALLTGCATSNDASAGDKDTAGTVTAETSTAAPADEPDADSARDELPEGFPSDVPLPGFTGAHKVAGSTEDSSYWIVVLELTSATETPVADYAAMLEAEGYVIDGDVDTKVEAVGSEWDISFHSGLGGTITISVMEH